MTVYISADAKNLREELASLRNQGGYEEQQFYFDGLVTNGTFDTDTSGWTANAYASLSVVSGSMRVENNAANLGLAYQAISLEAGKTYQFSANVVSINGVYAQFTLNTSNVYSTNVAGSINYTVGLQSFSYSPSLSGTYYIVLAQRGSNTIGYYADFDNIAVFEVDANDDVVHRMPKGWVPKDVFEDGLLQREGAANDYEVVYDGFDYYVKPAVAPSATTQTCVIGVRK